MFGPVDYAKVFINYSSPSLIKLLIFLRNYPPGSSSFLLYAIINNFFMIFYVIKYIKYGLSIMNKNDNGYGYKFFIF